MSEINTQKLLDELHIPIEVVIPLPYGFTLKISLPESLNYMCDTPNQVQALEGLITTFQGVLITLSWAELSKLASAILIVSDRLGVILTVRDEGLMRKMAELDCNLSIEQLVEQFMLDSGMADTINNRLGGLPLKYLTFEELVPLWWKVVNSRMIYAIRDEYEPTHYSIISGLDEYAHNLFSRLI